MTLLDWSGVDSKNSRRKKETLDENLAGFSVLTNKYAGIRGEVITRDHALRARGRFSNNGYSDSVDENIVFAIGPKVKEFRTLFNEQDSLVKLEEDY